MFVWTNGGQNMDNLALDVTEMFWRKSPFPASLLLIFIKAKWKKQKRNIINALPKKVTFARAKRHRLINLLSYIINQRNSTDLGLAMIFWKRYISIILRGFWVQIIYNGVQDSDLMILNNTHAFQVVFNLVSAFWADMKYPAFRIKLRDSISIWLSVWVVSITTAYRPWPIFLFT